jgi:D-3-phosphoglycerate dehydrogenase
VLAEAMGMNVIFYDIVNVMPLGNSTPMPDLDSLLRKVCIFPNKK